jgi:lipopolysaccharide export system permease protein
MAFDAARELTRNAKQGVENALDDAASKVRLRNRHAIEWHRKFFLASSCILLFFIGAPLGAIIRKGGLGMPTVVAIVIFLAYYIVSIVGEQMIKSGTLGPVAGMWLSTVVMLPIAAWLTWRAMRDAHVRQWNFRWPSRRTKPLPR